VSTTARKAGRLGDAIAAARRCLAIDPSNAEALHHLAGCLLDLEPEDEAVRQLRAMTESAPDFPGGWMNLGTLLLRRGETAEAESAFRRAVALAPESAHAHQSLGNFLAATARYAEAMAEFDRVLAIDAALHPARLNRGLMRLVTGDFSGGWRDYEARLDVAGAEDKERFADTVRWTAAQPLAGKTLLVHAEQGIGDAIQFVRYVPLLAEKGANVLVEVPPSLQSVLEKTPGAARVFAQGEPVPPFHLHVPMLSLPLEFATELASIPPVIPIVAAPEKMATWAARTESAGTRLRVGFVWSGNATHVNDRNRSIPLATFRQLIDAAPDCRFFSLQKNPPATDVASLAMIANVSNVGPDFRDFADTAAAIATLDLVITVDTSIAHLAGTMGKPVWILLPLAPDWRWLVDRRDSPWYPSARLFRQQTFGDWSAPLAEVAAELAAFQQ
jgi:tetratricopeptide (TPR) repeat protein